jgi:hypothetical protein
MDGVNCLKKDLLGSNIPRYFAEFPPGKIPLYHHLFACYSNHPFDDPGEISFLSPWVKLHANNRILSIESLEKAQQIARTPNWLSNAFGFHFSQGTVRGVLFEDGCHSVFEGEIGEHHLEVLSWEPNCSHNLMDHQIEEIKISSTIQRNSTIPNSIRTTWYWIAPPNVQGGIAAVYCHSRIVYILHMTINVEHDPVSLSDISSDLQILQEQGATLIFVRLVDIRTRQWAFLKKPKGMLEPGFWWSRLPQRIGLLCPGAPSGLARSLYDERDDIVDE